MLQPHRLLFTWGYFVRVDFPWTVKPKVNEIGNLFWEKSVESTYFLLVALPCSPPRMVSVKTPDAKREIGCHGIVTRYHIRDFLQAITQHCMTSFKSLKVVE